MNDVIKCPSGMSLSIRDMRGGELRILQDKVALRNGTFLDQILNACALSVEDPGPYNVEAGALPKWDDVLLGDKFFALLKIRALTFGDMFTFDRKCSECSAPYKWDMKFSDLPVKALEPDDAKAFREGLPLLAKVPSTGAAVKFRLGTGKDEKRVAKSKSEANAVVSMLALRISEIEGVAPGGLRNYLEAASLGDLFALLREMDVRDCGVETTIETNCPECGNVESVELPIGPGFWVPRKA